MKKRNHEMGLFLLIAFLLPFLVLSVQPAAGNAALQLILYGIEAAAPTIAALAVLSWNRECKSFFRNMFHRERLCRAVFLPVITACLTMFPAKLIVCLLWKTNFAFGTISSLQFLTISWTFVAEEIGWRGYLEQRLRKYGVHPWLIPVAVGVIWCLWHYHYFLSNRIAVPIWLFALSCIVESCLYSFFMDSTRNNLVSAMTYHFVWNLSLHLFGVDPADCGGSIFPHITLAVLETLTLLIFFSVKKIRTAFR